MPKRLKRLIKKLYHKKEEEQTLPQGLVVGCKGANSLLDVSVYGICTLDNVDNLIKIAYNISAVDYIY